MELWQAYKTIRRRWLLILALMIVGTVIAAAQGVVQKQTWRASATINIGPGTGNDYVASISRVADQLAVLTSRQILTRVDEMLGYNRRLDDYEKAVRGTRVNDSNVMRVDVRWSDPEQARDIANTLADVFIETGSEQIRADAVRELRLLADQLEPARERLRRAQAAVPAGLRADDPNLLAAQEEVAQARQALITVNSKIESARARATNSAAANGMYVVDRAVVPREPEESGGLRTVVFGALMGLFLGMVLAVGMQYLDATPRLLDTLHKELAAPILAVVPWERHFGKGFYPALNKLSQGRREAFRLLRTHLMLQRRTVAPHLHERFATRPLTEPLTVLVVAERPNAGASSVVTNLGVSLANSGQRVLLIDANFVDPSLHRFVHRADEPGLNDWLIEPRRNIEEFVLPTDLNNLFCLPAGGANAAAGDLLAERNIVELVRTLSESYDAIIVDAPALNRSSDARLLSEAVEGIIGVVRPKGNDGDEHARRVVAFAGDKLLGVVLNGMDLEGGLVAGQVSNRPPGPTVVTPPDRIFGGLPSARTTDGRR